MNANTEAALKFDNEEAAYQFARFARMDLRGDTVSASVIDAFGNVWNHAPIRTHGPRR